MTLYQGMHEIKKKIPNIGRLKSKYLNDYGNIKKKYIC